MKIYIDTSVVNGFFADDAPVIQAATSDFFALARRAHYHLYVSDLVLSEIERTKDAYRRKKLLNFVHKEDMHILTLAQREQELADAYIRHKVMTRQYLADALHIAVAVNNKIPILVSWNFKHMVRHHTRMLVNQINEKLGHSSVDICSPQEV